MVVTSDTYGILCDIQCHRWIARLLSYSQIYPPVQLPSDRHLHLSSVHDVTNISGKRFGYCCCYWPSKSGSGWFGCFGGNPQHNNPAIKIATENGGNSTPVNDNQHRLSNTTTDRSPSVQTCNTSGLMSNDDDDEPDEDDFEDDDVVVNAAQFPNRDSPPPAQQQLAHDPETHSQTSTAHSAQPLTGTVWCKSYLINSLLLMITIRYVMQFVLVMFSDGSRNHISYKHCPLITAMLESMSAICTVLLIYIRRSVLEELIISVGSYLRPLCSWQRILFVQMLAISYLLGNLALLLFNSSAWFASITHIDSNWHRFRRSQSDTFLLLLLQTVKVDYDFSAPTTTTPPTSSIRCNSKHRQQQSTTTAQSLLTTPTSQRSTRERMMTIVDDNNTILLMTNTTPTTTTLTTPLKSFERNRTRSIINRNGSNRRRRRRRRMATEFDEIHFLDEPWNSNNNAWNNSTEPVTRTTPWMMTSIETMENSATDEHYDDIDAGTSAGAGRELIIIATSTTRLARMTETTNNNLMRSSTTRQPRQPPTTPCSTPDGASTATSTRNWLQTSQNVLFYFDFVCHLFTAMSLLLMKTFHLSITLALILKCCQLYKEIDNYKHVFPPRNNPNQALKMNSTKTTSTTITTGSGANEQTRNTKPQAPPTTAPVARNKPHPRCQMERLSMLTRVLLNLISFYENMFGHILFIWIIVSLSNTISILQFNSCIQQQAMQKTKSNTKLAFNSVPMNDSTGSMLLEWSTLLINGQDFILMFVIYLLIRGISARCYHITRFHRPIKTLHK